MLAVEQLRAIRSNASAFDDAQLVVQVEAITLQFVVDDLLRALVALDAFAREHLHVDDRAAGALVDAQRRVLHVRSLLAEDRAQQLFFRRQRGLALRRDLADQHVARVHFSADVDDARLVETAELHFARFGMSRVISSEPSFVSRAMTTSSSMWIEV